MLLNLAYVATCALQAEKCLNSYIKVKHMPNTPDPKGSLSHSLQAARPTVHGLPSPDGSCTKKR